MLPEKIDCEESLVVAENYRNKSIDSDLFIFILIKKDSTQSYIAKASPCRLDSEQRPEIGKIVLNSSYFEIYSENSFYAVNILLHELVHLLGFSQTLLKKHPLGYSYFMKDFGAGISSS